MAVVAAIVRSALVGEHAVVGHVVRDYAISRRERIDDGRGDLQIAQQSINGDVDGIISEPTTVGPTAGNESAVAEWVLNIAFQNVAAENTQSGEARGAIVSARRRYSCPWRRSINLEKVGDEDSC